MKNAYSNSVGSSLLGRSEVATQTPKVEERSTASGISDEQKGSPKEFPIPGSSKSGTSSEKHTPGRPTLKSQGLKKRKQITITITEEMHQESMYFAKSENLSLAKYIEKALDEYKQNHHNS